MKINGFIYFSIAALVFMCILATVYFMKKRIKNRENSLYSILLLVTILNLVLEVASGLLVTDSLQPFRFVLKKLFMVSALTWTIIFFVYTFIISVSKLKLIEKLKKSYAVRIFASILYYIVVFVILVLPLYAKTDENGKIINTYGLSQTIFIVTSFFMILIILLLLLKNIKNLKTKKYIPIIFFVIMIIIESSIQILYPEFLMLNFVLSISVFLMYFTIENPDVRLIEALNIAKDQAERANNAKTEFLSSMSHEIRTPLNAIVGFSQSLSEDDSIPLSAKDQVNDILTASDSLLEIVNGILDISKIEANKLEIISSEYEIKKILDELLVLTKVRIGNKPIELKVHIDETLPPVLYGDHIRLKQIILNLLTNAAKYTNEGWINFSVQYVNKDDICHLIISVSDTGIGIKKENINKLFTKFERLQIEKSSTIEGTGLGLAITKKLVELMNGQIVVQSVYGEGSRFTVSINQRIVPKTHLEEVEVSNKPIDCANKKVLIVDDNTMNLKVASRLLSGYHLVIDTASSGAEAISKIQSGMSYDLILMDDMMPHMSGVEAFQKLKEIPGFSIPTIALTANAISGIKEKYLQAGFDDYMPKPIDKKELNRILQKFLQS